MSIGNILKKVIVGSIAFVVATDYDFENIGIQNKNLRLKKLFLCILLSISN